jgi:hypothetical protein
MHMLYHTMLSEYFRCPICNKELDYDRMMGIMTEGTSYNITHFDPKDPIVVSESESYCSTDCFIMAVIKQETEHE